MRVKYFKKEFRVPNSESPKEIHGFVFYLKLSSEEIGIALNECSTKTTETQRS